MAKGNNAIRNFVQDKNVQTIALVAAAIYLFSMTECGRRFISGTKESLSMAPFGDAKEEACEDGICPLSNGAKNVSSALLPKEIASDGELGDFAADDVLKGQSFLDPRAQVGYPESVGGALRNANRQIRADPPNPRDPVSIFNTSTIVQDSTRNEIC